MRCRAWVTVEQRVRKTKTVEKITPVGDAYERDVILEPAVVEHKPFNFTPPVMGRRVMHPEPPKEGAVPCGGEIVATVEARDEPYYGGTNATLEIEYKCKRCGWTFHGPDLPTDAEALSTALTQYVAALPEPQVTT